MSIVSSILNMLTQTAVYWGNPVSDGLGGKNFNDPIEIQCRWEDKLVLLKDSNGKIIDSKAVVYTSQELDMEGIMVLGTLNNLNSAQEEDPMSVPDSFIIKGKDSSPDLVTGTGILYKVYLT
jgi:hypothetical protein